MSSLDNLLADVQHYGIYVGSIGRVVFGYFLNIILKEWSPMTSCLKVALGFYWGKRGLRFIKGQF